MNYVRPGCRAGIVLFFMQPVKYKSVKGDNVDNDHFKHLS